MIQDAHTRKISIAVTAPVGDTVVIQGQPDAWIYVHELIGDLAANGSVSVLSGSTILASFTLDEGQGITEQDEPGEDNRPRFECKPGDNFILRVTGGTFQGAVHYSLRY
jgi:hypothetical protein